MTIVAYANGELVTDSLIRCASNGLTEHYTTGVKLFHSTCGRFAYGMTGMCLDPKWLKAVYEPLLRQHIEAHESDDYVPPLPATDESRKVFKGSDDEELYYSIIITRKNLYHTAEGNLIHNFNPYLHAIGTGRYHFIAAMHLYKAEPDPIGKALDFVERHAVSTRAPFVRVKQSELKEWSAV